MVSIDTMPGRCIHPTGYGTEPWVTGRDEACAKWRESRELGYLSPSWVKPIGIRRLSSYCEYERTVSCMEAGDDEPDNKTEAVTRLSGSGIPLTT